MTFIHNCGLEDSECDGTYCNPAPCEWPEWWPAHGSLRACHEGDCRRCGMEQEHGEGHEGEPCPWDLSGLDEFAGGV